MIARLSLEVFYIITRKLVGAFYVDQKKKDLLPSTLPSEHEQWGSCDSESYYEDITFPVTFCDTVYVVSFNDAIVSAATKRDDIYLSSWDIGATTVSKARMLCLRSDGIGRFTMIAIGK